MLFKNINHDPVCMKTKIDSSIDVLQFRIMKRAYKIQNTTEKYY